jgi:peptide/nickel transport system substrate-binding protein
MRYVTRGCIVLTGLVLAVVLFGCGGRDEVTREEAETRRDTRRSELLEKTVSRPGPPEYRVGAVGGTYVSAITSDPKTFNDLTARDADTRTILDNLSDFLADYDPYEREFQPNLASFEIEVDQEADSLRVIFTLRDDIYWTTPGSDPSTWVQLTADDIVFWYDEINGDPDLQLPGYPGQFVEMPDGTRGRITVEKLDELTVAFNYPRIVANPILNANMKPWPRHIYEPAKRAGGSEALLNVHSVDTDVSTIPSVGPYHIVEYTPGVRVVLQRNPNYWKTDEAGTSLPYLEQVIYRIVPDDNTAYLLFREGTKDGHSIRPEQLDEVLSVENPDFTVYDGGDTLGSAFFVFNQNPSNLDPVKHGWFTQREFRQAMSSVLNRPRIARQVYRGLATPAEHFFARPNPFFDEDIRLEFTYNPERAVELLASIGIEPGNDGLMYDAEGNHIEFSINLGAENPTGIDIANIFADELGEIGITANVRPIDFQNLVDRLTTTFDWEVATVALGANYWPESGSNVWQSSGNFHLWYPLQSSPATEWEARIDHLYNEGRFTIDEEERWEIYNEFQTILLTELPLMYIVHPLSFFAIRDRWQNVYYDTLDGTDSRYFFLESSLQR